MYTPTSDDYALLDQSVVTFDMYLLIVDDNGDTVDTMMGVVTGGTESIDANSTVRRTTNITMTPTVHGSTIIKNEEDDRFYVDREVVSWLNNKVVVKVGIENVKTGKTERWYTMGTYKVQSQTVTYDATTNEMQISCGDLMTVLDGTLNGKFGQLTVKIPAYEEDADTGRILKYYYIRPSMIQVLKQMGGITDYWIDNIGEYKGMKQYNSNYVNYRIYHPLWDNVPYDLSFDAGGTVLDIIAKLRDLYPNYETFFDENGKFICQMIPSCKTDAIFISNDILQKYLLADSSESTDRDLTQVKNVCEVWGEVLDTDYYSDSVTNSDGVYTATISGITDKYMNGDKIALKVPSTNQDHQYININNLGEALIYDEESDTPLAEGRLEANEVYTFEYKKLYTSSGENAVAHFYLLGEFQVHALSVLTDGTTVKDGWTDPDTGTKYDLYSEDYFKKKYNCEDVDMTIIPDSPFTVQSIGERNDVKTGDDYENLTSDSLALARANYENWKNSRLTDTITITTMLIPWLDVNKKVSYRTKGSDVVKQYIIKSISHDFDNFTSQITMMTFYPLYQDSISDDTFDLLGDENKAIIVDENNTGLLIGG